MKKTFELNSNNTKLQNLIVFLILSPFFILGIIPLVIGIISVVMSLIIALPIFVLFYHLGLITEKEVENL